MCTINEILDEMIMRFENVSLRFLTCTNKNICFRVVTCLSGPVMCCSADLAWQRWLLFLLSYFPFHINHKIGLRFKEISLQTPSKLVQFPSVTYIRRNDIMTRMLNSNESSCTNDSTLILIPILILGILERLIQK